jgi:hypothetical protein
MITRNEAGQLNNYASEPAIYYAEYPSQEQQRQYALQGGLVFLLFSALLLTAFSIS